MDTLLSSSLKHPHQHLAVPNFSSSSSFQLTLVRLCGDRYAPLDISTAHTVDKQQQQQQQHPIQNEITTGWADLDATFIAMLAQALRNQQQPKPKRTALIMARTTITQYVHAARKIIDLKRAIHSNTFAYMDVGTPLYERKSETHLETPQPTLKKPKTVLEHVRKWQHNAKQPVHIFIDDATNVMLGCRTEHSGAQLIMDIVNVCREANAPITIGFTPIDAFETQIFESMARQATTIVDIEALAVDATGKGTGKMWCTHVHQPMGIASGTTCTHYTATEHGLMVQT